MLFRSCTVSGLALLSKVGALDHIILGKGSRIARKTHATLLHQVKMLRHFQRHVRVLLDEQDGRAFEQASQDQQQDVHCDQEHGRRELVGLQMGLNFASFFDPVSNAQASAVSRFFGNVAMLVFIVINGHLTVLMAVIKSFEIFPVDSEPLAFLRIVQPHVWGCDVFALGLVIALPLVGMLLFVNLVLGLISRVAPQINVFAIEIGRAHV